MNCKICKICKNDLTNLEFYALINNEFECKDEIICKQRISEQMIKHQSIRTKLVKELIITKDEDSCKLYFETIKALFLLNEPTIKFDSTGIRNGSTIYHDMYINAYFGKSMFRNTIDYMKINGKIYE
jgi:hypothetical protein